MGWLDSLLGDEQKFIENKDSDACETGSFLVFAVSSVHAICSVCFYQMAKIAVNPTIVLIE
jgi:hypothetical protein